VANFLSSTPGADLFTAFRDSVLITFSTMLEICPTLLEHRALAAVAHEIYGVRVPNKKHFSDDTMELVEQAAAKVDPKPEAATHPHIAFFDFVAERQNVSTLTGLDPIIFPSISSKRKAPPAADAVPAIVPAVPLADGNLPVPDLLAAPMHAVPDAPAAHDASNLELPPSKRRKIKEDVITIDDDLIVIDD
jgi:hypothetical protein